MTLPIHRRDALKTTAALGAGVWLGTSARPARAAANENLNVAVIGVGGQGASNHRGVSGENVVALCDVDENRAGKAFANPGKAKKFSDFRKMFDAMEGQIDAVTISTPDHTHFHPCYWAFERGKHVYLEKPMAHNVTEVRTLTDMAREKNLATQLGVQRHTIGNMHRVVELIQAGAIGDVTEVHSWVGGDRGMPGQPTKFPPVPDHLNWDVWLGPAEERSYSDAYCPYNWRFWWDFGTGEMGNWGCHILDIPYWALGLTYPTKVDASGPEVDPERTPKSMATHFDFPAVGDRSALKLHWYHTKNGPPVLKELGLPNKGNNVFIGSEGTLVCDFGWRKLYPEEKFADYKPPAATIPNSPGFHKEWIMACKGGEPATCNFNYSGPMTETVLLGNVAYRAGGGFDWDAKTLKANGNDRAAEFISEPNRKGWEV